MTITLVYPAIKMQTMTRKHQAQHNFNIRLLNAAVGTQYDASIPGNRSFEETPNDEVFQASARMHCIE